MPKYFDTYRVKRELGHQDMMLKLIREADLFKDYSKVLMISAIVGYINDSSEQIERNGEPVQLSFFSERDRDIMDLLAYASTEDQSVLDREEKYEIFERYAKGGFPILLERLGVDEETEFDERTKQETVRRFYALLLQPTGMLKL